MTSSSCSSRSIALLLAALGTFGCGKTTDATGDETHFGQCTTDTDCGSSNATCVAGACRPSQTGGAPATVSGSGSSGGGAVASSTGGGTANQSTGGVRSGTGGDSGRSSGGLGGGSGGDLADASRDVAEAGPSDSGAAGSDARDGSKSRIEGGSATPNQVGCGTIPPCEPPAMKCCSATFSPGGGGCGVLSAVCSSNISLECDGPEDCATGVCSGEPYGGGLKTECLPAAGSYLICHSHTQCPGSAPNCCPIWTDQFTPYLGTCDTRTTLRGLPCDLP